MSAASNINLTEARLRILQKLAASGNWIPHVNFYSSIPERPKSNLRSTRFGRKMRTIPYEATFRPMVEAGLIEEKIESGQRRLFRITDAGLRARTTANCPAVKQ